MSRGGTLSGVAAARILAGVALRRLLRSKTLWIVAVLALVPLIISALVSRAQGGSWRDGFELLTLFMVIVPPLLVAAAVSEEIEDRTYTYLWSRPFPRWSMVVGKVLAGAPIAIGLLGASAAATFQVTHASARADADLGRALLACVVGGLGVSMIAAGIAALAPRLAQRLTYAYLFVDLALGQIDFSLQNLSITFHIRQVAGVTRTIDPALGGAIWCVAIGAFWLAIGLVRLRRAEYADDR